MSHSLTIILDYENCSQQWKLWADGESRIDFRKDTVNADRCTTAYACSELKYFLSKAMPELQIHIDNKRPKDTPFIHLQIAKDDGTGGFSLKSINQGIIVTGNGRNGLLNAAYELLRIQGWRWLEPGPYGEVPPQKPTLDFLKTTKKYTPSFKFRLIDQYRESDDSLALLKWFSRNHINTVLYKPATIQFAKKLGMYSRIGGHLLWVIMHPDALMEDGRTLWEAHPDWFGMPPDKIRTREHAADTQLCLSNTDMLNYLSAKVCDLLQHELKYIDILDLWGFDTFGNACCCPKCKKLGNGSDQNLYLLAKIQEYLLKHLDRPVRLNTLSYEGTATMVAPTKPIPKILTQTDCMVIFYPIARCYEHLLGDEKCELNKIYSESIQGWSKYASKIGLWSGEYYNVSRFEDFPLVLSKLIPDEMRYYHSLGCNGATYMHNFGPNWGVRTLTQLIHTQYAWDIKTDDTAFKNEYFKLRYKSHASNMKKAYALIEQATRSITIWRGFGPSFLRQLIYWEGETPETPLTHTHIKDEQDGINQLRKNVDRLEKAMQITQKCIEKERSINWKDLPAGRILPLVLTPRELEKHMYYDTMEYRLSEDLRGVQYGKYLYEIELALMEYYRAKRLNKTPKKYWEKVEAICNELNRFYAPITYNEPGPGFTIKDALSRSQLRRTITRCRGKQNDK